MARDVLKVISSLPTVRPQPTTPDRIHLKDLSLEEIEAFITGLGKERYRARQIMKWIYQHGATSFAAMTTLAKDFRGRLEEVAVIEDPRMERVQTAKDGTKKVLFRLADGAAVESVLIPGKNHWTACLSTQVGCAMGCRFCLTGAMGFTRNLTPGEITGQMTRLRFATPEGERVRNIVLMGMGEPLANYDHTVKAVGNLLSDYGMGFSNRKITISTCGLAPMILRLGRDVSVNLAVSLNAPDDERRSYLMPVNRRYPLETLLKACREYPMPGRRMLTFEYILIRGFNDAPGDAVLLADLLKGIRCKLNLIAFNEFPGSPFRSPEETTVRSFQQILLDRGYTAILRASHGRDILAACGQLAGR
ncbi:MAG TPA: 23S rRNA (adenine(2503)-C(2))-methyltransferase RlmN [Syntrophales bacterium]|nr:23S rRNA (adenine(2503)-C(2))-methyltransferase RlmN [Syntrophales bacterium]HON99743.1 23S rRNA (adenine(2503)-C(2))-methyltransferase RlmN [Syntrophales bacterium]HPC01270.1 23S rRNA (adenine(2503)-C(2))-methyltransferase RlmN [Syntrophales bacterium]HPQ06926.1 23S rRNA (adenine(2503)-C(2))-methyltransferase RlmN [Syntrophales bacterium]HRS87207.1 23S rRNA (adenine(2503)-C(2))-methyltransferase RlmN [Syntrophales bacterium]